MVILYTVSLFLSRGIAGRDNFFIFEVVKANAAVSRKHPETPHYTGAGVFMFSGKIISRKKLFPRGVL